MFLDHVAALKLLEHNHESNILRDFSLSVRKVLVSQVVTFLLDPNTPITILSSPSHVRWAMETCGQGFALPIEEEKSITQCIELYRRWALEPLNRPPPIEGEQQYFLQQILRHYSLLFSPRATGPGVDRHAKLCSQVLDIYVSIGRQIATQLSKETWEIFLKLMIGIADSLFSAKRDDGLKERLIHQTLKVLFELWLHSRTRNPDMWSALKKRTVTWTHLMPVINQWNVTTLALTLRSTALLYGSSEGTDAVIIKLDDQQYIPIEDEYVYYAWHRMLHILGNPNRFKNPKIFLAAFNGIEILVNQYLKVGTSTSSKGKKIMPPDGNTILHIFGAWLFEAMQLNRPDFDEGTALAVKIISCIFKTRHSSNFLPVYLSRFFHSVSPLLVGDGRVLISAIMHSHQIFTHEIQGSRVLVPPFIYAVGRILTKKVSKFDHIERIEVVRNHCYQILNTLFCLPNYMKSAKFQYRPLRKTKLRLDSHLGDVFKATTYEELKPTLSYILIEALKNETYPPNVQFLLHLVVCYMFEDIKNDSTFTQTCLSIIIKKVVPQVIWDVKVSMTALRCVNTMGSLYGRLKDADNHAEVLVTSLCKYAISLCESYADKQNENTDREIEELVDETFKTITTWILVKSQWIVKNTKVLSQLLQAIFTGLVGSKVIDKEVPVEDVKNKKKKDSQSIQVPTIRQRKSPRIQASAECMLENLLRYVGNYPTAAGNSRVSTLVREEDLLAEALGTDGDSRNNKQFIRFCTIDTSTILTFIDRPHEEPPATTVIIRNKIGKTAWSGYLNHLPFNEEPSKEPDLSQKSVSSIPFIPTLRKEIDDSLLRDVYRFLERQKNPIISNSLTQVKSEHQLLQSTSYGLNKSIYCQPTPPADPYQGNCKFQQSRLLASHLGFLSHRFEGRFCYVDQCQSFLTSLKKLDDISERECMKIGVVYMKKGQVGKPADYLRNVGGSENYQDFISSLGWGANIESHNGYLGGLGKNDGTVTPYYANFHTEVVFHIATLMPNVEGQQTQKLKHLANDYVLIIWTEDLESFVPDFKHSQFNNIQIVVFPMDSGLYRIRIFQKNENMGIGPLQDNMVVSKHLLGSLIRETCIVSYRLVKSTSEGLSHQYSTRARYIEEVINKFRKETDLASFYKTTFCALDATQDAPSHNSGRLRGRETEKPNFARINPSASRSAAMMGSSRDARDKKTGHRRRRGHSRSELSEIDSSDDSGGKGSKKKDKKTKKGSGNGDGSSGSDSSRGGGSSGDGGDDGDTITHQHHRPILPSREQGRPTPPIRRLKSGSSSSGSPRSRVPARPAPSLPH